MKIAILHHDLEWSEKEFKRQFGEKGIQTDLFDVRKTSLKKLLNYKPDLVMNRVYASVANRDWKSNLKTLDLLKDLEKNKIECINSYLTTKADYSKFFAYKLMKNEGIPTPETCFINNKIDIDKAIEFSSLYGFPLILKRDIGGRGKDLTRVENKKELLKKLEIKFSPESIEKYNGGHVIQQFIKSNREHDARIVIINNKFIHSYGRLLISKNGEEPWLASYSKGSKLIKYCAGEDEKIIAKRATKSINALFNEVDITFTENEPIIIENNPTPQHTNSSKGLEEIKRATKNILNI